MNWYSQLRELLCKEDGIREDIEELREATEDWYEVIIRDKEELELRHILWYMEKKIFWGGRDCLYYILTISDNKLPLSSQDEVCKKIYDYLITL